MYTSADKKRENHIRPVTNRQLASVVNDSDVARRTWPLQLMISQQPVQYYTPAQKNNATGLPDQLKTGIENLSGYSMDDVKVHYNSVKPLQLQAHAYAQGTDIHIAPGQEKHLPHEAWHVVQQKQGRVKPTRQMKGKVQVNDDRGLETEADVMGKKALNPSLSFGETVLRKPQYSPAPVFQRVSYDTFNELWRGEFLEQPWFKGWFQTHDPEILANYREAEKWLPFTDFLDTPGSDALVDPNVVRQDGKVTVRFDRTNPKKHDADFYIAAMIHELIHVANAKTYRHNTKYDENNFLTSNLHVPKPLEYTAPDELSENQVVSVRTQLGALRQNWQTLRNILDAEKKQNPQMFTDEQSSHLENRIRYGEGSTVIENDTVLFDMAYYLEKKGFSRSRTFLYVKRMLQEARTRRNKKGKNARVVTDVTNGQEVITQLEEERDHLKMALAGAAKNNPGISLMLSEMMYTMDVEFNYEISQVKSAGDAIQLAGVVKNLGKQRKNYYIGRFDRKFEELSPSDWTDRGTKNKLDQLIYQFLHRY